MIPGKPIYVSYKEGMRGFFFFLVVGAIWLVMQCDVLCRKIYIKKKLIE